jgi:hypothetical protein
VLVSLFGRQDLGAAGEQDDVERAGEGQGGEAVGVGLDGIAQVGGEERLRGGDVVDGE